MTMHYDKTIFQAFKALSIQNSADLKMGVTYYTNLYPESFVPLEIITWAEMNRRQNSLRDRTMDDTIRQWIEYQNEYGTTYMSCHDRNMDGESYNPWMIFADPETAERCRKELVVTWTREPDDEWYNRPYIDEEYDYSDIDPLEDADGKYDNEQIDEDDGDRQTEHELYEKGWR